MTVPSTTVLKMPILKELVRRGGRATARQIIDAILSRQVDYGLSVSQADLQLKNPSGPKTVEHRFHSALSILKRKGGLVAGPVGGVWSITAADEARVSNHEPPPPPPPPPPVPDGKRVEPGPDVEASIREQLADRLSSMSDKDFENFVGRVLEQLGYDNVDVVGRSGDGGVDVTCILKGPLLRPPVSIVCQVKRHATSTGPSAVGDLRGRWAHRADRLILVNTGGFTHGAQEAATEVGAKEVSLVSGEELANLLIEKGIGVIRQPVVLEKVDEAFFSQSS